MKKAVLVGSAILDRVNSCSHTLNLVRVCPRTECVTPAAGVVVWALVHLGSVEGALTSSFGGAVLTGASLLPRVFGDTGSMGYRTS